MRRFHGALVFFVASFAAAVQYEPITACLTNGELIVRSAFSPTQDVVIRIHYKTVSGMPNEEAFLVPKSTPLPDYKNYPVMHAGSDDFPAYIIPMYGILGGNHGSCYGRELTIPEHGMTAKDLGTELTAKGKGCFYLLKIIDKDRLLIHPESQGKTGFPKFESLNGEPLCRAGRELKYARAKMQQVYPSNRYLENTYLVNGKRPLQEGAEVTCDYLDHVVDYEIVLPEARVALFKNMPGVEHDFVAPGLPALLNIRTVFRHQANGACVAYTKTTALCDMPGYKCLGVMMCWSGAIAREKQTEFYIPKLKPLHAAGRDKGPALACDFSAVYTMPDAMPVDYNIMKTDCLNPEDPPDRFIRLSGDKKREIGVALGYSLFDGVTAKRFKAKDRDPVFYLWWSKKMYPFCITLSNCPKGDVREVLAYRQYFDPQREPDASSFYFHKQRESDVIYLDFHKPLVKKTIRLPDTMTGKKIVILEHTPSVVLHTEKTVPKDGLCLSISSDYGYIVLKLD